MLTLYPAIDLIDGRCVRLTQGNFARQSQYHDSPTELAVRYREAGSEWLHVIDLDAARTAANNMGAGQKPDTIQKIAATSGLRLQCGGGIQSRQRLQQIFDAGIERAIVGSLCVKEPALVQQWIEEFGPERIVLALDIDYRNGTPYMAIDAWQELSDKTLWQLLAQFSAARHLLCTDISRDGTLRGPNFALYQDIQQRFPQFQVQASGGIATLGDIERLRQMGTAGAVLGKSLLEGRFTLEAALSLLK